VVEDNGRSFTRYPFAQSPELVGVDPFATEVEA
jgi:hypothetical protein